MSVLSVATFVDCVDKSINLDQWGATRVEMDDWIGKLHPYVASLQGQVIDNSPVGIVSRAAQGSLAHSGMEHWISCLNLLVHV